MIKRTLLLLLSVVLFVGSLFGTTVTGTTKDPSTGNLFNGSISFSLNYNGGRQISTNQILIVPRPAPQYTISNGVIPSGLTVVGNDDISPSKTIYLVAWFDLYGALVRVSPYSITGTTFDLGTAIPTPITTSNVSVLDLIGLRTLSVTGASNFATSSGRVGIGTSNPTSQFSNLAAGTPITDQQTLSYNATQGQVWYGTGVGYQHVIIGQGGVNVDGLLVKTTTSTNRILTANCCALSGGNDVFFITGNGISGNGSGFKHVRVTGCTTAAVAGSICANTITWPTPFADAAYTVVCTLSSTAATGHLTTGSGRSASQYFIGTETETATAIFGVIDCIAIHDN